MKRLLSLIALTGALALVVPSGAQIVPSGPVNGLTTFTDTKTGLIWADLNNFFGESYNQMAATVQADGFTVADVTHVTQLLNSLPLDGTGTNWDSYAAIMGSAPNRQLIWGSFLPDPSAPTLTGWAYAYRRNSTWSIYSSADNVNDVPNHGTPDADLNIWAYTSGSTSVPEPGAYALLASLGLTGVAFLRRRRARK